MMSEFKRAEPIEVPEDWYEQACKMSYDLGQKAELIYDKYDDFEEAQAEMRKQPLILRSEDVLAYFETVLATDNIQVHWKNYAVANSKLKCPTDSIPESEWEWGRTVIMFEKWWIMTRFDVNNTRFADMSDKYALVTGLVLCEYYLTGDVEKAYQDMHVNMKKYGFDMGDDNG